MPRRDNNEAGDREDLLSAIEEAAEAELADLEEAVANGELDLDELPEEIPITIEIDGDGELTAPAGVDAELQIDRVYADGTVENVMDTATRGADREEVSE